MDRMSPSEGDDVGSIPAGSTVKRHQKCLLTVLPSKQTSLLACRNRKTFPYPLKADGKVPAVVSAIREHLCKAKRPRGPYGSTVNIKQQFSQQTRLSLATRILNLLAQFRFTVVE